jgi:hypothetical protein
MIQDSVGKKVTPDLIKQLYQEELGRLPEEGAVSFYQDLYGDTFDQRELDQFRGSTEAEAFESDVEKQAKVAESQPGLENLYQDILFREADPTGLAGFAGRPLEEVKQEIMTSPEAMGPARIRQAFEEVVKRPVRPEDMTFYQERFGPVVSDQERAGLVRAMRPEQMQMFQRELGIPTLDFSKFGTTPERAGISRLMPAETEEAAAEEGMRTGGIARLYKEGGEVGDAGLANIAQKMASYGRYGDTMLAHISPEEARMLKAMGGSGTRNPVTGLPEFFLKKLIKNVFKIGKKILPAVVAAYNPVLGASLAAADAGFKDGKFDLKAAALAGAKTYALSKAGQAISGGGEAAGGADVGVTTAQAGQQAAVDPVSGAVPSSSSYFVPDAATVGRAGVAAGRGITATGSAATTSPTVGQQLAEPFTDPQGFTEGVTESTKALGEGFMDAGSKALGGDFSGFEGTSTPLTVAGLTQTAEMGVEEAEKAKREQQAIIAAQEEKKKKYRDLASDLRRRFPYGYKEGGVLSLPPRYLDGEGDGMSDSIKANIGGLQEARLADGEFVVPADVVADLGNGSSNAGAERLYSMMDRIRQARHGTTKQPPEVNVNKTLPA